MTCHFDKGQFQLIGSIEFHVGAFQVAILRLQQGKQPLALHQQIKPFARFANDGLKLVGVPWLGNVTVNVALIDRIDDRADVGVAGEEETNRLRVIAANLTEKLHPGHFRHPLVRHHDVNFFACEHVDRIGGAGRSEDAIIQPQQILHALDDVRLIVHHENRVLFHGLTFPYPGPRQRRGSIMPRLCTACDSGTHPGTIRVHDRNGRQIFYPSPSTLGEGVETHPCNRSDTFGYTPAVPRRILLLNTDLEIGGTPTVVRELAIRLSRPPEVIVDVACLSRAARSPINFNPTASPSPRWMPKARPISQRFRD